MTEGAIAHLRANLDDGVVVADMIENRQLAAMRGEVEDSGDKIVNNNFNRIEKTTVEVQKHVVIQFSKGRITAQMLTRALKKRKTVRWELYKFMTSEDDATPVAPGTTTSQILHRVQVRVIATGDRAESIIWVDDLPARRAEIQPTVVTGCLLWRRLWVPAVAPLA